jgi:hypothetical protein
MYLYLYLYLHIFISISRLYTCIYIYLYLYLYITHLYLYMLLYLYLNVMSWTFLTACPPFIYVCVCIFLLPSLYLSVIYLLMSLTFYLHLSWHTKCKCWTYWLDLSWTAFSSAGHSRLYLAEWRQNILTITSDRNSQLIASVFQKKSVYQIM